MKLKWLTQTLSKILSRCVTISLWPRSDICPRWKFFRGLETMTGRATAGTRGVWVGHIKPCLLTTRFKVVIKNSIIYAVAILKNRFMEKLFFDPCCRPLTSAWQPLLAEMKSDDSSLQDLWSGVCLRSGHFGLFLEVSPTILLTDRLANRVV